MGGPHDKKAHRRQKSKEKEVKEVGPGRDGWQRKTSGCIQLPSVACIFSWMKTFCEQRIVQEMKLSPEKQSTSQ